MNYRSAISTTHSPIDGVVVGKHRLAHEVHKRSLQCSAPTAQIYDHLGCGAAMVIFGEEQGLQSETAYSQTCRCLGHQIHEQKYRKHLLCHCRFDQNSSPRKEEVNLLSFLKERLCPVDALNEYLTCTQQRREGDQSKTRLFLSVVKPYKLYKLVVKSTIAKWPLFMKLELGSFSLHSVRRAAAAAAHCKLSMKV